MRLKKLSVITICYNDLSGLKATYRSLHSSIDSVDWIVIDGGSNDGTLKFLNSIKSKTAYMCSESDNGIYDAMNKGLDKVKSELVLFLNSGDVLKQGLLSEVVDTCLLPVEFYSKAGKLVQRRVKYRITGMPYCHQGIVYPVSELRYEERFSIAADFMYTLENFGKDLPEIHAGIVIHYDMNGTSEKYKNLRRFQSVKIWLIYKWRRFFM